MNFFKEPTQRLGSRICELLPTQGAEEEEVKACPQKFTRLKLIRKFLAVGNLAKILLSIPVKLIPKLFLVTGNPKINAKLVTWILPHHPRCHHLRRLRSHMIPVWSMMSIKVMRQCRPHGSALFVLSKFAIGQSEQEQLRNANICSIGILLKQANFFVQTAGRLNRPMKNLHGVVPVALPSSMVNRKAIGTYASAIGKKHILRNPGKNSLMLWGDPKVPP